MPLSLGLKIALIVALLAGSLMAETLSLDNLDCPENEYYYAARKRTALKMFQYCQKKKPSSFTFSVGLWIGGFRVVDVPVYQKDTDSYEDDTQGMPFERPEVKKLEKDECLNQYTMYVDTLAACLSKTFPQKSLFSREELSAYFVVGEAVGPFWEMIDKYGQENSPMLNENVVDRYNEKDETFLAWLMDETRFVGRMSALPITREDKDVALLYFRYLKMKYDRKYCVAQSEGYSECRKKIWVERQRSAFFEKYPDSRHRAFIKKEMVFEELTPEEEENAKRYDAAMMESNRIVEGEYDEFVRRMKERREDIKEEKEIAAEKFQWGISAFGAYGPLLWAPCSDYDDQYDVSALATLGSKFQYRWFAAQFQYDISFGDNAHGDVVSYKGFSVMAGVSAGAYKVFVADLLLGVSVVDAYPVEEKLHTIKNTVGFAGAFQLNYFIPITKSLDIFPHVELSTRLAPYFQWNARQDRIWGTSGDLMTTISFGLGVRFWKPKTKKAASEERQQAVEPDESEYVDSGEFH